MKKLVRDITCTPQGHRTDIEGMARIGYAGEYEVFINTDDPGSIPHVHVRDKNNWKRFHCCVKLETAEYFPHGNKVSEFNSQERKLFAEFMESLISKRKFNGTVWDYCTLEWDANNSKYEISDDVERPDYRKLPNKKR